MRAAASGRLVAWHLGGVPFDPAAELDGEVAEVGEFGEGGGVGEAGGNRAFALAGGDPAASWLPRVSGMVAGALRASSIRVAGCSARLPDG
jgi:hypothetical protein